MLKHIPNFITSLNLFAGCIAIVFAFNGQFHLTGIFIALAALFDFLDGMSARLLKAYSEVGKQLDSLADMISFGFTPAVVLFMLLSEQTQETAFNVSISSYIPYLAFLITIFSALRLAIFNIDTRQTERFIGLPTPANAIFIISLPFAVYFGNPDSTLHAFYLTLISNTILLVLITLVFSFMLIAPLPLFSLKFKTLRFNDNVIRYAFLIVSAIALIIKGWLAIPLIIIIYILLSLSEKILSKH